MVEDVCHPCRVVEVGVEELKVLSQAVPRGDPAAQPVVVIHDAPAAGASVVGPQQLSFGVVVKNIGAPLAEEAVLIHAVLDISQARDAVSEVVAERQDAGTVPGIQQMEVTVQVVAVAPGRPVIHLDETRKFVNESLSGFAYRCHNYDSTHKSTLYQLSPHRILTLTPLSCPSPS